MAYSHSDGSWLIVACDGLGGHARGADAAQAAISAFPERICGQAELDEALGAANDAVCGLYDGHRPMRGDNRNVPMTTVASAAWTPQRGLCAAWLGDSLVAVLCGKSRLVSLPHGGWVSASVGTALGWTPTPSNGPVGHSRFDPAGVDVVNERLAAGEHAIALTCTDGLYGALLSGTRIRRDTPDSAIMAAFTDWVPDRDDSIPAERVAETMLADARSRTLQDNAAIAVASIDAAIGACTSG